MCAYGVAAFEGKRVPLSALEWKITYSKLDAKGSVGFAKGFAVLTARSLFGGPC